MRVFAKTISFNKNSFNIKNYHDIKSKINYFKLTDTIRAFAYIGDRSQQTSRTQMMYLAYNYIMHLYPTSIAYTDITGLAVDRMAKRIGTTNTRT